MLLSERREQIMIPAPVCGAYAAPVVVTHEVRGIWPVLIRSDRVMDEHSIDRGALNEKDIRDIPGVR